MNETKLDYKKLWNGLFETTRELYSEMNLSKIKTKEQCSFIDALGIVLSNMKALERGQIK